jgi:hypothetical protein
LFFVAGYAFGKDRNQWFREKMTSMVAQDVESSEAAGGEAGAL